MCVTSGQWSVVSGVDIDVDVDVDVDIRVSGFCPTLTHPSAHVP